MLTAVAKAPSPDDPRDASDEDDNNASPQTAGSSSDKAPALPSKVHSAGNFRDWSSLLSVIHHSWRPGKTLNLRQPDVELLVLTLSDVPLTADKFAEMSSGRDFVVLNVCVLAVGPPGFSSVPYAAAKKSGAAKVESKVLYDVDESGNTRFFPFEKGATNKDRGERVSQMTVAGCDDLVDATTVIVAGTCLSFFMRQENFMGGNPVLSTDTSGEHEAADILPAKSTLALVLGSNNVVQASKGYGLKLKKGKQMPGSVMLSVFSGVPQSEEQSHGVLLRSKAQPTICNMAAKDDIKVFGCVPDVNAHATTDCESDSLVMCNIAPSLPEVFFSWAQLEAVFGVERGLALKLVNVAIATKAVRLLVMRDERPTSDPARHSLSVASMAVDWNYMLWMHSINGLTEWPTGQESWDIPCTDEETVKCKVTANGTVLWTCPGMPMATPDKCCVYWALKLVEDKSVEEETLSAHFVTDEKAVQGGHSLDLYLALHDAPFDTVFAYFEHGVESAQSPGPLRHQMRLRFRPERKGVTGHKKRTAIQWD